MKDPKEIVKQGYNAVSYAYRADVEDKESLQYHHWLDELIPLLPKGARVLDLGCGCGVPVAKRLANHYQVVGIDLSPVQIERAQRIVPQAEFLCADMTASNFEGSSFDAVLAFYSLIHIPLDEQPAMFQKIAEWLKPGGLFMATVGWQAWTGQEENWLGAGAAMYWSHADEKTYLKWLHEKNFEILWKRFVPEGNGGHTLLLAKRKTD